MSQRLSASMSLASLSVVSFLAYDGALPPALLVLKNTGSIGMLPSASLDANNKGLYEPSHGSAPDIAGKGVANPLATILSAAMMLRYTFDQEAAAQKIEMAVKRVLAQGYRTGDIYEPGTRRVGTREMGEAVIAAL